GTKNLRDAAHQCDAERGVVPAEELISTAVPAYTPAGFRTCIIMQSATAHRPFNFVTDRWYQTSVEMLRPGASADIPDPTTVSRAAKNLYLDLS
ncbi:hypothetical protein B0H13DRAFT_1463572, partial [Mycena leptocephala]